MILLLMLLETILLPIQNIPLNPANETKTVLILLQAFLLLTDLCELVNYDGSNDLIHDDLDDEEIAEIHEDVPEGDCREIVAEVGAVVETDETCVCLEAYAEGEDEAVVKSLAVCCIVTASVVEVENGG